MIQREVKYKIRVFRSTGTLSEGRGGVATEELFLSDALCTTNMFTVAYNLPKNLFIADGSRTLDDMDITPDWGAGNETQPGIAPLCAEEGE